MNLKELLSIAAALFVSVAAYAAPQAQPRKVSGTVIDTDGEPLYGVWVELVGVQGGTATDIDGNYSIDVPAGGSATLKFSYIGMAEERITLRQGQTRLDVTMKNDTELEAAIVTGYGLVQKRSDMTGSAYQVNSEKFQSLPAARIDNLLDGMVPGMVIDESNTGARTRYNIRIRGDASLSASSNPLWIVDGVPIYTGDRTQSITGTSYNVSPLSFLNPDDIESMTVLKDAATTSIYGANGANGIILVTTKQASGDGSIKVSASARYGISKIDRQTLPKFLSTEQWWELARLSWTNAGYDLANFPYQDSEHNSYSTTSTDWYDVYFGMGNNMEVSLRIDSGSDKTKNYLSTSYFKENSTTLGNVQHRFSIRDKMSWKFTDRLSLDLSLAASYNVNDIVSVSTTYLNVIPIFSPYDEDGVTPRLYNYYSRETDRYEPKMYKFVYSEVPQRDGSDNQQRNLTSDGSVILSYKLFDWLELRSTAGVSAFNIFELIYDPKTTLDGRSDSTDLFGYSRRSGVFNVTWNNVDQLNFDKTIGRHKLGALLGIEFVSKENHSVYAYGRGFANDHIKEITYAESSTVKGSSSASNSRSLSYFGQMSYSYDSRYYLSASYRRQGQSEFSKYNRWSDYASVGLSWNAHNEAFYNIPWMNRLKFKFSYGTSGNSNVNTSSAYGTYTYSSGKYYGGVMGASQGSVPNPGLTWETTYITNAGIDIGLFNNRVELSFEAYRKLTVDMLYSGRVSSILTSGSVTRNVGSMENKGLEGSIITKNIDAGRFSWTTEFNGAVNRNIIRSLYKDMHTGFFDYVWVAGASKDAWWLSRWAGIDPTTGAPMWYDFNGNLTYTFSYDNRVLLPEYDKQPNLRGGMRNTFRFGDFSLIVMLTYTLGGWDFLSFNEDGYDLLSTNTIVEDLDYWKTPGQVSNNPKPVYKLSTSSTSGSTRFLFSKTNVQFKNVVLNYNVPRDFCKKLGVRSVNASLILDNPYMWCPGQSRTRNSYKTLFNPYKGVTRSLSASLTVNF